MTVLFGDERDQLRRRYVEAWRKHREGAPLEPLERQIAGVVLQHPEYQLLLDDADAALTRDYLPEMGETNPFLHMGLHIAIQEQLSTDRPSGIIGIYQRLLVHHQDAHAVEHLMIERLAETLWQAQRDGCAPDETAYLERLRQLT